MSNYNKVTITRKLKSLNGSIILFFLIGLTILPLNSKAKGDGRNGPDLEGVSIPVSIDRGIKLSQLQKAEETCLVKGDKSQGLQSFMDRLSELLWSSELEYSREKNTDYRTFSAESLENKFLLVGGTHISYVGNNKYTKQFNFIKNLLHTKDKDDFANRHELNISLSNTEVIHPFERFDYNSKRFSVAPFHLFVNYRASSVKSDETHPYKSNEANLISDKTFPFISWIKQVDNLAYDELGNYHIENVLLQGVIIQVPENYGNGGEILKFINAYTDHESQLQINVTEYVECLQSEIQKNAN